MGYTERVITMGTTKQDKQPLGLKQVLQFLLPALMVVGFLYMLSPNGIFHTLFFDSRKDAITEVLEEDTPLGYQVAEGKVAIEAVYSQEYMEWMESIKNTNNVEQWDELVESVREASEKIHHKYYVELPNSPLDSDKTCLVVKDGQVLKDTMRPQLEGGN